MLYLESAMVTHATQDYLKVIFKLSRDRKAVSTNAIADKMDVSQASVTAMLKKLSELKLITYTPYYGVNLTHPGRKIALEIIRHHRLLELYLFEALGYSWDRVHEEAEKLERVISEEFEEKIVHFLDNPTIDPHGAPIPGKDGKIQEHVLVPLTDAEVGQKVRVERVSDSDSGMLRYMEKIGILPEVEMEVLEKAPFRGPLRIQIGEKQIHMGESLSNQILISEIVCDQS